ncbi:MAG: protein translocase subunit SecDF [Bacteroidota bacterium]
MRNKNTIIFLLVVFTAICGYNLYYTFIQYSYDRKITNAREAYEEVVESKAPINWNFEDSSVVEEYETIRDDQEFQQTYKKAIENSFTLGLDLQGGMFVTLEVGVESVIRQLAGNPDDEVFNGAIESALKLQQTAQQSFVPLFVSELKNSDPNANLGAIFADPDRGINTGTPEAEVVEFLNKESESAIDRTFNIIRTRIDQFGVVSPNLQKQESTGRILLELPGVKDPERVRKLLRSTAKLEFWETHPVQDAFPVLVKVNEKIRQIQGIVVETDTAVTDSITEEEVEEIAENVETADSLVEADSFSSLDEALSGDSLGDGSDLSDEEIEEQRAKFMRENPLFALLNQPNFQSMDPRTTNPVVGFARATDTAAINAFLKDDEVVNTIPDDMRFVWTFKPLDDDLENPTDVFRMIAIKTNPDDEPTLGGEVVSNASLNFDERGQPIVDMSMNIEGAQEWKRITEANVGRHVAILLDGYSYSFPIVNQAISGGRSTIQGGFSIDEAQDLANVLKAGQLPVPARIQGEETVGPTLGKQNIRSGIYSFIGAFIITLIFMAIYYAKSGLIANLALIANMVFILGCSAAFTIVLTLPGLAAVILIVGMSVDANVLIFERIREELAKEKTLKASIKAGFQNALSSVMDGNITTFLTGVVLYAFGVGPIRGFAVSLMIGIITSLVSALIITRLILDFYANKGKDSISFGFSFTTGLFDKLKLNMVSRKRLFYMVSFVLMGASVVSFVTQGFKTGVDFKGGRQFVIEFVQNDAPVDLTDQDVEQVRSDLTNVFESDAPQIKTLSSDNQLMVTSSYLVEDREATDRVQQLMLSGLKDNFGDYTINVISASDVGPTVASDIRQAAYLSVIGSLLIIFFYILIRFRKWQYSAGAIAAIFHDVTIVLGVFSLLSQLDLSFNLEINQALIAALLTIIGYSINDTVVVFDRIRENLGEMKSSKLSDIFNISIDQTISRTLITSVTTFLTALILFIWGGDVIKGFIFAIMIGIVVGTYSSIFVASPISLDLLKRSEGAEA